MKLTNKELTWYYKHFLFRNMQTINNIMATKLAISEKQMPGWVETPCQEMLDDLLLDLGHALMPLMKTIRKEYAGREDRLRMLAYLEDKVDKSKNKIDLVCHCAACKNYEKESNVGTLAKKVTKNKKNG